MMLTPHRALRIVWVVATMSINISNLCFRCHVQAEVMQDFTRRCQYPSLECVRKANSSSSRLHPSESGLLNGSSRTATGEGSKLRRSSSSNSSSNNNNTIRHHSTSLGPTDDCSIEDCSSDEDTSTACCPSSNLAYLTNNHPPCTLFDRGSVTNASAVCTARTL